MMIDRLLQLVSDPDPSTSSLTHGAIVRRARWLPALGGKLAGMREPAAAVTIGRTIVLHPDSAASDRLLRHELEHVRQWRQGRFAFPLRYILAHIRHGYAANPYEVAARRAESPPERQPGNDEP